VTIRRRGDSPGRCIEYAVGQRHTAERTFDEVWCVLDVDQFDINEAERRAGRQGVALAVSNPCFELWLLLHLVDVGRPFIDCREVGRVLAKECPGYDKSQLVFGHFRSGIEKAVDRAKRLEGEVGDRDGPVNPSSGMWRLVTRIIGES
jgi:hypothetical protein